MPLYLVTAPPVEPITLAEAKAHSRIDHEDDDDYISSLIRVAREKIDGRDGYLGRAIVAQTWDWKFERFDRRYPEGDLPRYRGRDHHQHPWWRIELPLPPLQSVVSVKYLDIDAVEQTISSSLYVVTGSNGWQPARIEPAAANQSWPSVYCQPEAIRIRLNCGYAPKDPLTTPTPISTDYTDSVPESIKLAIKIMVAAWYENRELLGVMPDSVPALLATYRTNWIY